VHVLDRRKGFVLISACHKVLAAILTETAAVEGDRLARLDRATLMNRGYCRHCIDTLR
jgi:hypothetical protein